MSGGVPAGASRPNQPIASKLRYYDRFAPGADGARLHRGEGVVLECRFLCVCSVSHVSDPVGYNPSR